MLLLVYVYHLHQDFLYVLISGYHYPIDLKAMGNQISVYDLELLAELPDHFPI